jgi:hypothetical protein
MQRKKQLVNYLYLFIIDNKNFRGIFLGHGLMELALISK